MIPVARSYDNHPWEKAAGEFAASLFNTEDILCYEAGCQINLPPLEADSTYQLSSVVYSLSEQDEYARFLETATFGITQEDLDAFASSSRSVEDDIISWVSDQMDPAEVPMTSHREYWRKRLNGRVSEVKLLYLCYFI
jgi:hypothetical protein